MVVVDCGTVGDWSMEYSPTADSYGFPGGSVAQMLDRVPKSFGSGSSLGQRFEAAAGFCPRVPVVLVGDTT